MNTHESPSCLWMICVSGVLLTTSLGCQQTATLGPEPSDEGETSTNDTSASPDTSDRDPGWRLADTSTSDTASSSDMSSADTPPRDASTDDTSRCTGSRCRDTCQGTSCGDADIVDPRDTTDTSNNPLNIKRVIVQPLGRAGSRRSDNYTVPAGSVFSFEMKAELQNGDIRTLPTNASVQFQNTFGAIEVSRRPGHRYFLKQTRDLESIYRLNAFIDYDGQSYSKQLSIRFWEPDQVKTRAVLYPSHRPRGMAYDRDKLARETQIGPNQTATPYLVILGYQGRQVYSRNVVPPALFDNVTFNTLRGSGSIATWEGSVGRLRAQSSGTTEVTITSNLASGPYEASVKLTVVDGTYQGLTALQSDGDEWESPWSFVQGASDECRSYHLAQKYADAQGREYFVLIDWSKASITHQPSGVVRLDPKRHRICPIGPYDREVTETITYRGETTTRRIGVVGLQQNSTVTLRPSPLQLQEIRGRNRHCANLTIEVTPPQKSTRTMVDNPFLALNPGPENTRKLAANTNCTPKTSKGFYRCCSSPQPSNIRNTEIRVRYLGGASVVPLEFK